MTTTPSTLDQKALRTAIQEEYEAVNRPGNPGDSIT